MSAAKEKFRVGFWRFRSNSATMMELDAALERDEATGVMRCAYFVVFSTHAVKGSDAGEKLIIALDTFGIAKLIRALSMVAEGKGNGATAAVTGDKTLSVVLAEDKRSVFVNLAQGDAKLAASYGRIGAGVVADAMQIAVDACEAECVRVNAQPHRSAI